MKEKPFKFTGKNASKYNNKDSLDYLNDIAKESGLKLGYTEDGFGAKLNALIKKMQRQTKMVFTRIKTQLVTGQMHNNVQLF